MRPLNISVTSMLAVAAAVAIATPAYATKSPIDVSSRTGNTYVAGAGATTKSGKADIGVATEVVSGPADEAVTVGKAPRIDQENARFIAAQKEKIALGETTGVSRGDGDSSLSTKDLDALDKTTKKLDNLIGNVVGTAIDEDKVDKHTIDTVAGE
jgi:hypothetical protein